MDPAIEVVLFVIFCVAIIGLTIGMAKGCHLLFENDVDSFTEIYDSKVLLLRGKEKTTDRFLLITESGFFEVCEEDYNSVEIGDVLEMKELQDNIDIVGDISNDVGDRYWKVDSVIRKDKNGKLVKIVVVGCSTNLPRRNARQ